MIWLIGNSGLLGQEIELMFKEEKLSYIGTASQVDITNLDSLQQFTQNKILIGLLIVLLIQP